MKKGQTMEQYMAELENKKLRAEAFQNVLKHIDQELEWKCNKITEAEGYYSEYTDDEGNVKKRWHSTVYKTDEDGNDILIPPEEGDYYYPIYMALKQVREEILEII